METKIYIKMKLKTFIKYKPQNLINMIRSMLYQNKSIFILYNNNTTNWGDALNNYLVNKLSHKEVFSPLSTFKLKNRKSYMVIGSILGFHNLNNIEVWGYRYYF